MSEKGTARQTRRPVEDIIKDRIEWLQVKLIETKKQRLLEAKDEDLVNVARDYRAAAASLSEIELFFFSSTDKPADKDWEKVPPGDSDA